MNPSRRNLPHGALVLAVYVLFTLVLVWVMPDLGARDQPLYLLIPPTLLASLYYPRWVYGVMCFLGVVVAVLVVEHLNRHPQGPLWVLGWAFAAQCLLVEFLHFQMQARLKTEDRLRESEARYRSLVEQMPAVVYTMALNQGGKVRYVSPHVKQVVGLSPREWMSDEAPWETRLHPEDRQRVLEALEQSWEARRPFVCEYRLRRADGTSAWIHDEGAWVEDGGQGGVMQGVWLDITDRKHAEEAQQESDSRWAALCENASDIVYSHDLLGNISAWNRAGEAITGFTREETVRMNLADLLVEEDRETSLRMLARKLRGEAERTTYEVEVTTKSGQRVPLEVRSWLSYRDGDPVGVEGFARDISGRRQLEEQLAQSQKMDAIGRLAGGVAHDFNNILGVILGYVDMLLCILPNPSPQRTPLEQIKQAAERAAGLTRQLLAVGRRQIVRPELLDLNEQIREMELLLRRVVGEDLEFVLVLHPEPLVIHADRSQIEQTVLNLVLNARDAMPHGGTLSLVTKPQAGEVGTSESENLGWATLVIADTGHGMDAETRARMFEPFFTTKAKGKGTGLGLSTVYGIVAASHGRIEVESEPGFGTSFRLSFPRVPGAPPLQEPPESAATGSRGAETILLVEDEPELRELVGMMLADGGYQVLSASRGEEALQRFEENGRNVSLLVTDVVMPGWSGSEVARKLQEAVPDLPVLYVSGYPADAVVRHGVEEGRSNFLAKPFTCEQLLARVREVLDEASDPRPV